jgi:two-component system, LytTR family, sensor kinase
MDAIKNNDKNLLVLKLLTIPTLALATVLALTSYPIDWDRDILHFSVALCTTFLIWEINGRAASIVHHLRSLSKSPIQRLIVQIGVSIILSWGIIFIASQVCSISFGFYNSIKECFLDTKDLYLVATLFSFLIVAIYENNFTTKELFASLLEKEKYKKSLIEVKCNYLSNQLNPHYLFNNLNTLSNLIKEDPEKAYIYTVNFSATYQYILSNSDKHWVSIKEELEFTDLFLELAQMRFEDSLVITKKLPSQYNNWLICPLSVQMLVENAIKHNVLSPEKKLKIEIFHEDEYVIVKNNIQRKKNIVNGTQTGLKNIQDRYLHLVHKEISIIESDDSFIVKIPLINPNHERSNN